MPKHIFTWNHKPAWLIVPEENNYLHVYCSSQGPQAVRSMLANCLAKPANKLIVETKRAGSFLFSFIFSSFRLLNCLILRSTVSNKGGAFGGELSRNFPAAAAVIIAAIRLNRPVRIQMDRN
jgi:xanthine dehydrogenase molybdopterin-binding subunit B